MTLPILALMLVIVLPLAFYAGTLVFRLRAQSQKNKQRTTERIDKIVESITTIASAMNQQQCNMSEGCIRLYHLLEALPLVERPDYSRIYVGVYSLYNDVKELASHEARAGLSPQERHGQDTFREEREALLETAILRDVDQLRRFSI